MLSSVSIPMDDRFCLSSFFVVLIVFTLSESGGTWLFEAAMLFTDARSYCFKSSSTSHLGREYSTEIFLIPFSSPGKGNNPFSYLRTKFLKTPLTNPAECLLVLFAISTDSFTAAETGTLSRKIIWYIAILNELSILLCNLPIRILDKLPM